MPRVDVSDVPHDVGARTPAQVVADVERRVTEAQGRGFAKDSSTGDVRADRDGR